MVVTFIDVTSLARAEEQQRVLVAELNHRVKNMLAVVVGIAGQTLGRASDAQSFGKAFLDRLHALARSYELVTRDHWSEVSLLDVVRQEVEPYRLDRGDRIVLDGPLVSLSPKMALSLGMIVHELGTNAAKYGSLSVPAGSLKVAWTLESRSDTHLVLDWKERGGPPVTPSNDRGFGLTLIEREVEQSLAGKVRIEFAAEGLHVNLRIPLGSG